MLARNHHWRDLIISDRAITSLNIINQVKLYHSTQNSNKNSTKKSDSNRKNKFQAPVVLSRYKNFKLSSDIVRSRTLKVVHRDSKSKQIQDKVIKTERQQTINNIRQRINQYTRRKSRRDKSIDNPPQANKKLIKNRFIIKSKSNILKSFDVSKDDSYLCNLTQSRIENRKLEQSKQQMDSTRQGWSKIMKCLQF